MNIRTRDGEIDPGVSDRQAGSMQAELASRRAALAFQRTRMSADRTLMAVIRTSLSLIGFGFTIYQFFKNLQEHGTLAATPVPRHFGATLIYLGVGMVVVGIVFHVQFMLGLRREREAMKREGLIHGESEFPVSFTRVIAILLLVLGLGLIANLLFDVGPSR